MKAAILKSVGSPLAINSNVKCPNLKAGQVLVKLAYSGVCQSQLMEVRGKRGVDEYLPHLLGHEGSGIVQEVGEGVKKVKAGDRVVLGWIKGEGIDIPSSQYCCEGETINSGAVTTFSEFSVVSENRLVKLPDDIPMKAGVLFGCAIPTGSGIVLNEVQPEDGAKVLVLGVGGIGLSALIALQLYKCSQIIAIDIEDEKLELAKELGATNFFNISDGDIVEKVMALTDGGVDYSIEASGLCQNIELAHQMVRENGGLCVFASHPPAGEKIALEPHDLISGKMIKGSWGGACKPDIDLPRFFDLYRQGKLPIERLLNRTYQLDEINQALDDLENRRIIRALIEIAPELDNA